MCVDKMMVLSREYYKYLQKRWPRATLAGQCSLF